jgi:membrane glycosyltransferase
MMWSALSAGGVTVLEICLLLLFTGLFAWTALSFTSSVAGFLTAVFHRGHRLGVDPAAPLPTVHSRTALLMPVYHEDPGRVLAGLRAIYESVAETGSLDRFDFFVLSDTRREDIARAEEQVFAELRDAVRDGHERLFYRRRGDNGGRKAGNIADWVRRFGGAYPQMLILDADSLMSGDTIVRLVAGMEANADVGLIQTRPAVIGGHTLFARAQQFSGRVYGPVIARGVAWWHGAESNYWGHNAIIRTRAFAGQAGLPALPGRRPFGGHVLSHDFVEAALMRRGGWAAHLLPYLKGSYEEGPPTLAALLVRDRRWCQGNLQHSKVVGSRGLHWISRAHLMIGIGDYLTAPMWALLMAAGIAVPLSSGGVAHGEEQVVGLFGVTMAVLLAPKVLGYLALLFDPADRRGCGGAVRAFLAMVLETVLSALLAPVVMYAQSRGVVEVLLGKDSGWDAQQRDEGRLRWWALLKSYGWLSVPGVFVGALAWTVSPALAVWMSPQVVGMVLAVPLVALTSSRGAGGWLHRLGLLDIPEENAPPPVLARAAQRGEGGPFTRP